MASVISNQAAKQAKKRISILEEEVNLLDSEHSCKPRGIENHKEYMFDQSGCFRFEPVFAD